MSDQVNAQDLTPPTLEISTSSVTPGKNGTFNFSFTFFATDDQGILELEYRGKVDGKPLDDWQTYPYYEGYEFPVNVDCSYFRLDVRSKDTSGNYSAIDSREFKAPFNGKGSIPVEFLAPLPFTPNIPLTTSPAVLVNRNNATIILRKIILPLEKFKARAANVKKPSIVYQVTYKNINRKETNKLTSKKNTLTLKNLSPGQYSINYKAQLREAGKIISSTKSSPVSKFSIK